MAWAQAGGPSWALLVAALCLVASIEAGPLPNVTITEMTTKAPTCAIGDVVYALGEQFTGSGPCERCSCGAEGVRCARRRCEPRPGCKAVHRPDSCCPTYQCECEQEGRVYANGEKLVDPLDPCRVCYCQGGEVVCRRIACFVRDDCRPRLVPGRCCPEYDNCPLRGVTSAPGAGAAAAMPSISTVEDVSVSEDAPEPAEKAKPEITIKEITPVSEIPIVTDVKIKEVLPSQSIEIVEYPSSKSPLIPREATSESPFSEEAPASGELLSTSGELLSPSTPASQSAPPELITSSVSSDGNKSTSGPSKITLSTLGSISAEVPVTSAPGAGPRESSTTRGTLIEDEDPSLQLDHNPAFPPIPDDLSNMGNHEDDIVQETNMDSEQVPVSNDMLRIPSETPVTETPTTTTTTTTTTTDTRKTVSPTSAPTPAPTEPSTTVTDESKLESTSLKHNNEEFVTSTYSPIPLVKISPMLNLRSAIPTELLNVPLSESEVINGELDDDELAASTTAAEEAATRASATISTTDRQDARSETTTVESPPAEPAQAAFVPINTILHPKKPIGLSSPSSLEDDKTSTKQPNTISTTTDSTIVSSGSPSESSTQASSLPAGTSDQHSPAPRAAPTTDATTTRSEPITSSGASITSRPENFNFFETTEFVPSTFGSAETSTDFVELMKNPSNSEVNAALIDHNNPKNSNVLNDLIKLVGDVASISDHAYDPTTTKPFFSDSEELIPVNAGYKSKNSNWNLNSISEVPPKSKSPPTTSKAKIVEIEDDETRVSELPAGARAEPTTRRPIIDRVSDDEPLNQTTQKDIEIITKSYVPTINRRPTKVIMQKNSDSPVTESADAALLASPETGTEEAPAPAPTSAPAH